MTLFDRHGAPMFVGAPRKRLRRAGYREAIRWIALNDGAGDAHALDRAMVVRAATDLVHDRMRALGHGTSAEVALVPLEVTDMGDGLVVRQYTIGLGQANESIDLAPFLGGLYAGA